MRVIWIESSYDYASDMSRDLLAEPDVEVVPAIAPTSLVFRTTTAALARVSPGLAYRWTRRWFGKAIQGQLARSAGPQVVCLFDSSPFALDPVFLDRLRQSRHCPALVSIVYNVIEDKMRARVLSSNYDVVYTFDPDDASRFGYRRFEGIHSDVEFESAENNYDLTFIGADKGRLDLLRKLFGSLTQEGLRCYFYVVSDRSWRCEAEGFVVSSARMPYSLALDLIRRSNCILDVVPSYQAGLSLRCVQAIVHGKRLLTNSTRILDTKWSGSEYISVFDSVEDVDSNFLRDRSSPRLAYRGEFSPVALLTSIRADIQEGYAAGVRGDRS